LTRDLLAFPLNSAFAGNWAGHYSTLTSYATIPIGGPMRNILMMSVLLSATWAIAQTEQPPSTSNPNQSQSQSQTGQMGTSTGSQISVQGCLSGSKGNYTITDKSGNSYQLAAGNADLASHVGQQVQVSGTAAPSAAGNTSATSGTSGTSGTAGTTGTGSSSSASQGNQLSVDNVTKISDNCSPSR